MFDQDNLTENDWKYLIQSFVPEGALLEIVVADLNEHDWDLFFKVLIKQFKTIEINFIGHKSNLESEDYTFEKFRKYFEGPEGGLTTFKVASGDLRLHLTIYELDRAELILSPYDVKSKDSILILLHLMAGLASSLKRTVLLKLDGYRNSIFELDSAGNLIIYPENMPDPLANI